MDSLGRELVLNGINHVTKSPEDRYVYPNDEQLFKEFRNWGINCIRYGINWDGLEPEPGQYNESYLQEIDRRVRWAEENGKGRTISASAFCLVLFIVIGWDEG